MCRYIPAEHVMNILTHKLQVLQANITWNECGKLPIRLRCGKTTVISGKVYCGGGWAEDPDDECTVYCYDPSQDKWTTLPPLTVKFFGLGQVNGKLVAVGGMNKSYVHANEVYTYDDRYRRWKQTIPPIPTARRLPGVLSLQSALVVAGGRIPSSYTAAVEIFKSDTLQWYRTDPLPLACEDISLVAIGNTCYVLGGFKSPSQLNQAFFASVDDFLRNAVPANQITNVHSGSSYTQPAWKTLPNTPTSGPAAAVLAGNLLAIGGCETSEGRATKKEVYMYSPSTNSWIYISDLPAPLSNTAVAVLSSTEILVTGGWSTYSRKVDTVYMAIIHLKL